ncbi:MAG TPA: DUF2007 domain-containing protein [Thermoanaerobaculia bacterium]|nr:DUF2007 domain-containing protein [Thermoanaerobaculia bacterium]
MKQVYVAENPLDAKHVKAFLDSAGIATQVRGEHLWSLRGGLPMTSDTLPTVWITYDEDFERARRLVDRLQARARLRSLQPPEEGGREPDEEAWEEEEEAGGGRG